MKGKMNKFIIKIGIVPKRLNAVKTIEKDKQLPLVFDINSDCVGVVHKHSNQSKKLDSQAEICFYDEYYNEYGKWHKIFKGGTKDGERVWYEELLSILEKQDEYIHIGYITDK